MPRRIAATRRWFRDLTQSPHWMCWSIFRPWSIRWNSLRRSLTPGGIFLFVVPVYDGPMGPIIRTLDRDPTHVHKRSRAWWLELISRKFEVTSWTGIFRYLAGGRFYLHLPTRALRQVAPAIAIVGKLR